MKLKRIRIVHRLPKFDAEGRPNTVESLAEVSGYDRTSLTRILSGKRRASPEQRRVIESLGIYVPTPRIPKGV